MQKTIPPPANNTPSKSVRSDNDDDSEASFECGANYNDPAYDTEDEEQNKDGQPDMYYCNVILEHLHDEDGVRLPPPRRFYQAMRDLVQILLSYDDKNLLMPASTTGQKPPIDNVDDVLFEDFNVGQYLYMNNSWSLSERDDYDKDGNPQEQPPIFAVVQITSIQEQATIIPAIKSSCDAVHIKIYVKHIQALNTSVEYVIFSLNSDLCNKGIEYIITRIFDQYLLAEAKRRGTKQREIAI